MSQSKIVLSENDAIQFLAFCLASARCLVDEPQDYGPMRLLQAVNHFMQLVKPQTGTETLAVLAALEQAIPVAQKERIINPEGFVVFLDQCCATIASELKRQDALLDPEYE